MDELSAAGVRDRDLTLVCANGLHRRWRRRELAPIVGPRLLRRFGDRITCYDGEDPDANVSLGSTESGLLVEVSRLVADADLVVYVAVPWTEMNGGHKSLACGLSTYACIAQHHHPVVQASSPLMSPESSAMHRALRDIGRHIGAHVPVFQVETLVNNRLSGRAPSGRSTCVGGACPWSFGRRAEPRPRCGAWSAKGCGVSTNPPGSGRAPWSPSTRHCSKGWRGAASPWRVNPTSWS